MTIEPIVTQPDHGEIVIESGVASSNFQIFLDDVILRINDLIENLGGAAVRLPTYTVATVPTAAEWTNSIIYVSDESGGAVTAFSDGTNWRRTTDRAIIS